VSNIGARVFENNKKCSKKTFILFKQTHKARPGLRLGKTYFHLVLSKHLPTENSGARSVLANFFWFALAKNH